MLRSRNLTVLAIGCLAILVSSCDQTKSQNTAPKISLKETLVSINKLAVKISEGLADGEVEKAHDPLHQLMDKLKGVTKVIDSSTLGEEEKKKLSESVDALIENFGAVDKKMHGSDEGAEFSAVKEKIKVALETMNKICESL